MDDLITAINALNDEDMLSFLLTVYWTTMIPAIAFVLQVNNWYPFRYTWRNRDLFQPYVYFLLIPISIFHIIAFIGGMMMIQMFTYLLAHIVTFIF